MIAQTQNAVERNTQALSRGHFRRIAERGFGDGHNAYAHSCAWFKDQLYIGTSRYVLPMLNTWRNEKMLLDPFPVPMIEYKDMDLRGQIWRYSLSTKKWELAFRAPLVKNKRGNQVPLANSFRNMIVFQGSSDPEPAIYTIPTQAKKAPRRVMLRSYDGENFEELPQPLVPDDTVEWRSFRGLTSFKGKLFASPASGQLKYDTSSGKRNEQSKDQPVANIAIGGSVRCSHDPASGKWERSSPPDMGDPGNGNIFDIGVCGDHLYVGTLNIRDGFQLWRTDGEGPTPHRWEKVLDRGAGRGSLNQAVQCLAEFKGDLYFGTCIQNGGYDKVNNVGPAGGEIIRVHPDGTWDLIVGDPRRTPDGFKSPTSGITSGFGSMMNGYFWRMTVHDGALYIGTAKLVSLWPFTDRSKWPEFIQRVLDDRAMNRLLTLRGGTELWRTTDGNNWSPVTINGFENHCNMGIRSLLSTPKGLFVGTANFYGPHFAIKHPTGWKYEENPRGGLEIWHGSLDHYESPDCLDESTPLPQSGSDRNSCDPCERTYEPEFETVDGLFSAVDLKVNDLVECQELLKQSNLDPNIRLALEGDLMPQRETVAELINDFYESQSGHNVGYWLGTTPHEASQRLVELVLDRLKETVDDQSDDCTKVKLQDYLSVGSSSSEVASEIRKDNPDAKVHQSGEGLPRAKTRYDAIVWIEGLRNNSAKSLFNRLANGGRLIGTKLFLHGESTDSRGQSIERFQSELARAGFVDIEMQDLTDDTWLPFFDYSRKYFGALQFLQQVTRDQQQGVLRALPGGENPVEAYVLFLARRPPLTSLSSGPRGPNSEGAET